MSVADLGRDAAVDLVVLRLGGRRSAWNGADIRGEVEKLRGAGARVTVVSPSPAAAAALGRNVGLLDPARRARAAREGIADGNRAAEAAGMPATPPAGRVRLAGSEG